MDGIASHLLVLERLVGAQVRALEYGMGDNSTPFLVAHCASVVSIEMQDAAWFDKLVSKISSPKWHPLLLLGPEPAVAWTEQHFDFDLVLVDGHGDSRWKLVNLLIKKKVPIIVVHDTQQPTYGWHKIVAGSYLRIDCKVHPVWTSVFTSSKEAAVRLKGLK